MKNNLANQNELVIPRGGENTVILADGTTVHLNAGSKLTYPVRLPVNVELCVWRVKLI